MPTGPERSIVNTEKLADVSTIDGINVELVSVLQRTMSVLQSKNLGQSAGLHEALPWADVVGVIAKTSAHPPLSVTLLNEMQRKVADCYSKGKFAHITSVEESRHVGDRLFALLIEQSCDESLSAAEMLSKLQTIKAQLKDAQERIALHHVRALVYNSDRKSSMKDIELYHVTSRSKLESIAVDGLRPRSYWASDVDLLNYYRETVSDEGEEPVVLMILLSDMDASQLVPDMPGLDEPITTVLGKSESDISDEWDNSDKNWQASLNIISSVVCTASIAAGRLAVSDDNNDRYALLDYLKQTSALSCGM